MTDHTAIQLALRAKLLSLVVATTGATSLSATATGYQRAAGSFVTDGFARGLELASAGFGTNTISVVTSVAATDLSVSRLVITINPDGSRTVTHPSMVVEATAGGRTLTAGLPSLRAWENTAFEGVVGHPYVEEQYIPGPEFVDADGGTGPRILLPMYSPRIYVPSNTGISADGKYADAIRKLFTPDTPMTLSSGEQLEVRGDVAPFRGQRGQSDPPGWSVIPVTIPLHLRA